MRHASFRWGARISSLVSIAVLLLFVFGERSDPQSLTWGQWIGLLLFPAGVMAGMVLAWKWEGLGGLLAIASLCSFYLYQFVSSGRFPRGWAFLALSFPALFFLVSWLIAQREAKVDHDHLRHRFLF